MKKTTRRITPTKKRSTRTRTGTRPRAATARRKAAARRKPATAANPLPLGKWVRGAVKLVKQGGRTLVQFAK